MPSLDETAGSFAQCASEAVLSNMIQHDLICKISVPTAKYVSRGRPGARYCAY